MSLYLKMNPSQTNINPWSAGVILFAFLVVIILPTISLSNSAWQVVVKLTNHYLPTWVLRLVNRSTYCQKLLDPWIYFITNKPEINNESLKPIQMETIWPNIFIQLNWTDRLFTNCFRWFYTNVKCFISLCSFPKLYCISFKQMCFYFSLFK